MNLCNKKVKRIFANEIWTMKSLNDHSNLLYCLKRILCKSTRLSNKISYNQASKFTAIMQIYKTVIYKIVKINYFVNPQNYQIIYIYTIYKSTDVVKQVFYTCKIFTEKKYLYQICHLAKLFHSKSKDIALVKKRSNITSYSQNISLFLKCNFLSFSTSIEILYLYTFSIE